MFNQKVNGYTAHNPDYVNYAYSAPRVNSVDIHNCGTTINKYTKPNKASSLPLQTWCSANVAVESFGMRPTINPKQYFETINKYLASIIYTDSINLKSSGLSKESYSIYTDYGYEPESSFIQTIKIEIIDKIGYLMKASADEINIFKEYNPLCEGFVITDIDIVTYRSNQNSNHFFHRVMFSAFNTTRYNTISFKAELYQDTTPMIDEWNGAVNDVLGSKNTPVNINSSTIIYVSLITLLNDVNCVTGQESGCTFKGYNLNNANLQLLNDNFLEPPTDLQWQQPDAITQNVYNSNGNYDQHGNIRIVDYGPNNIEELIRNNLKK